MAYDVTGLWLESDLTADEEAFVSFYTSRTGTLTLVPGGTGGYYLLWITFRRPPTSREERERRDVEIQTVLAVLSPLLGYPHVIRRSPPRGSERVVSFGYGPNINHRPTTLSTELGVLLRELGLQEWARVEVGRHLVSKITQTLLEPHPPQFIRAFTQNTDLVPYEGLEVPEGPQPVARPHIEDDVIMQAVMISLGADLLPLAVQASTGDNYNVARYFVIPGRCTMERWPWNCARQAFGIHGAYTHVHSSVQRGIRGLGNLLFHSTLFPGGQTQGALTGLYATEPALGPRAHSRFRRIFAKGVQQAEMLQGAGVPTLGGFLKTVRTIATTPGNALAVCSISTTTSKECISLRRMIPQQTVVCLGRFEPTDGPDTYPNLYRDSSDNAVRILETLKLVQRLAKGPIFSGLNRSHDPAPVVRHLQALAPRTGLELFVSKLPDEVRAHLPADPAAGPDAVEAAVAEHFLNVYCSLVFAVVAESGAVPGDLGETPLEVLQRAARLCACQITVLGRTSEQPGIRIVDDLTGETTRVFSVDQPSSTPPSPWLALSDGVRVSGHPEDVDWGLFATGSTIHQLLRHATVGSKEFFTRHMDRCSNGLIAQQAGVGPLDIPVSDYHLVLHSSMLAERVAPRVPDTVEAITPSMANLLHKDFETWVKALPQELLPVPAWRGQAMAMGEQTYKMATNVSTGATYAITEALTNLMFSPVSKLQDVVLTGAVAWSPEDHQAGLLQECLFACKEFCRELGVALSISSAASSPTLSERHVRITQQQETVEVLPFNSVVFTSWAEVKGSRYRVTPDVKVEGNALVYLAVNQSCLIAGSTFEHNFLASRHPIPPLNPSTVASLFMLVKYLMSKRLIVSGHDIGDGGLLPSAIEMALAGCRGLQLSLPAHPNPLELMVSETPGALVEVPQVHLSEVLRAARDYRCVAHPLGTVGPEGQGNNVTVLQNETVVFQETLTSLQVSWTSFSDEMWNLVTPPLHPLEDMHRKDLGRLEHHLGSLRAMCLGSQLRLFSCPTSPRRVAALVLPGSSAPYALMAALQNTGFEVATVTVEELKRGQSLSGFSGLITCLRTGCQASYASARGWVLALCNDPTCASTLTEFLNRPDTFSICCGEVGFQLLVALGVVGRSESSPYTYGPTPPQRWAVNLETNVSKLYDSHWLNIQIPQNTKSVFLRVLRGTVLPSWAQGEYLGVRYEQDALEYILRQRGEITLTYHGNAADETLPARHYPRNPTGNSTVAGLTSSDGRHAALIIDPSLMFHPWQWQHVPPDLTPLSMSPWAMAFQSIYLWSVKKINDHH
nr:ORF75 [Human gammaherpesvirus 8]